MIKFFSDWYRRYFSDPQAILLALLLALLFGVVIYFGNMLAPVLAAMIIAYLLEGSVHWLEERGVNRLVSVTLVFVLFMTILIFLVIFLLPVLSRQVTGFVQDLPRTINEAQTLLLQLTESYPQLLSPDQVSEVTQVFRAGITDFGRSVLSMSLSSIPAMLTMLVYLILGPLLVFFFLKDKAQIVAFVTSFLPADRSLLVQVWREMDTQIGNYVRGKVYEIFIVGGVAYAVFSALGLSYAPLLAVLVGLSVIVPYIGAAVVTVPVAVAAYLQMGWSSEFAWVMVAYTIIQAVDGNLLVPLLFSEAVNLHPVAIILAVLFFGGLWGFWGVFFAIPLATLVKALINAWPREPVPEAGAHTTEPGAHTPAAGAGKPEAEAAKAS